MPWSIVRNVIRIYDSCFLYWDNKIVDLLSSVALAKKSTDEELIARIRRTGSLSPEETISFLHVYKETINDLVELFSRDPELIRIMGLLDATD